MVDVFQQVVGAMSPEHFNAGDVVLLVRYCEAAVLAERAAKELRRQPVLGAKVNPWLVVLEKADRSLATLALRLRICPQSRDHSRTAGRRAQGPRAGILDNLPGDDDE